MRKFLFLGLLASIGAGILPQLPVATEASASEIEAGPSPTPLLSITIPGTNTPAPASQTQAPRTHSLHKAINLGQFKVTFYWMVEEDAYSGKKNTPLYTTDGKLIGNFTSKFVKDFRTESCALLSDGRIISYMKRANRCQVVDEPIGAGGYTLKELKSVAVDPSVIPIGSRLYIPEAEVQLNDSSSISGVFYAHDIGSAIKGNRIDVYLGVKSNMDLFRATSLCRTGNVSVYLLQ